MERQHTLFGTYERVWSAYEVLFSIEEFQCTTSITYAAVFITIKYALDNTVPLFEARNSTCAKITMSCL